MKRVVLTGAIAFLLGAATSPRAANQDETMTVLCARFDAGAGKALAHATKRLSVVSERLGTEKPWKDADRVGDLVESARASAVIDSLSAVRSMVCAK